MIFLPILTVGIIEFVHERGQHGAYIIVVLTPRLPYIQFILYDKEPDPPGVARGEVLVVGVPHVITVPVYLDSGVTEPGTVVTATVSERNNYIHQST